MYCRICEMEMSLVSVWNGGMDSPQEYAYNLYTCDVCGTITKEDVWDNKGLLVIPTNNFTWSIVKNGEGDE